MTLPEPRLNPYQPPPELADHDDVDGPLRMSFQLNHPLRRHAEAQFLLHCHPMRLLFASLLMIVVSCGVMIHSIVALGPAAFLPALIFVMTVSAAIYLALVHRSKQRIRDRQDKHGLSLDGIIELVSEPQRFTLVTASGTYHWPNQELDVYRTSQGLMVCPEKFLFIFIPKKADISLRNFSHFVRLMTERARMKD